MYQDKANQSRAEQNSMKRSIIQNSRVRRKV